MSKKDLMHMVFGGKVKDPQTLDFEDLNAIDVVGFYPSYAEAENAWRGASQSKVDDAMYKYVVAHMHRLIDPDHK